MKLLQRTLAACAVATSATLFAGTVAPQAEAGTAIGVNGFRGGTIGDTLGGWVWQGATRQIDLDYSDSPFSLDSSIASGVDALVALMAETPDVDRLIGESQSALVIIAALREHPGIVPEGGLTVYLVGNPGRSRTGASVRYKGLYVPILGLTNKGDIRQDIPGLTVYDVAYEYDLVTDTPNPANFLAVMNALAGGLILHDGYDDVDMTDPNILVRNVGNTKQYLVPAGRLPMLEPLYNIGLGALADAMAPGLRAAINAGHDREGYVAQGSLATSRLAGITGAQELTESAETVLQDEVGDESATSLSVAVDGEIDDQLEADKETQSVELTEATTPGTLEVPEKIEVPEKVEVPEKAEQPEAPVVTEKPADSKPTEKIGEQAKGDAAKPTHGKHRAEDKTEKVEKTEKNEKSEKVATRSAERNEREKRDSDASDKKAAPASKDD